MYDDNPTSIQLSKTAATLSIVGASKTYGPSLDDTVELEVTGELGVAGELGAATLDETGVKVQPDSNTTNAGINVVFFIKKIFPFQYY